ncbi:hypothetical protein CUMW_193130 [Citrus unshiu]|nr:hypothetical protein CUMW_193130 [Citrus unshiu]
MASQEFLHFSLSLCGMKASLSLDHHLTIFTNFGPKIMACTRDGKIRVRVQVWPSQFRTRTLKGCTEPGFKPDFCDTRSGTG